MRSGISPAIFLVLVTICSVPVMTSKAQQTGAISGTVVDENGQPLDHARVNAEPVGSRPRSSAVRYVETDGSGHFVVDRLAWGTYRVFAKKEEAGYPDMQWSFYSNDIVTVATVTPGKLQSALQITLGPRCGVLTGSVTNALNGAPVNSGLRLSRADNPQEWMSISMPPKYRVLLPPSTDVLLQVSAPGFKTWTPPEPVHLRSGEQMRLDIALEPSHDPNLHPSKFLIPDGYVGWVLVDFNAKDAPPSPTEDGLQVFKFSRSGTLSTSSCGPAQGAENEFFYYLEDGSLRPIAMDFGNGKGIIWGEHRGATNGVLSQFGFFVGTEEQYRKYQMRGTRPGPVPLR